MRRRMNLGQPMGPRGPRRPIKCGRGRKACPRRSAMESMITKEPQVSSMQEFIERNR